jgi:2-dehydropantoate 2-reductase
MKIGVVGAGAMGSLFGARLVEAGGADVVLVDVDKAHIDAIREKGLAFESRPGSRRVRMRATTSADEAGKVDFVIMFCKYPDTPQAIRKSLPMLTGDTVVWTPQNGVGNVDVIAGHVPKARIAKGLTSATSMRTAPGQIHTNFQGETETFIWPVAGGANDVVSEAARLLTGAGLPTFLASDIDYRIWRKLCVNAALSMPTAAINTRIGAIGETETGQALMRGIVAEVVAVAGAKGIPLTFDDGFGYVEELRRKAFEHVGSATFDMQNKRITEVEAVNGAVVREGRKVGVATPINATITRLVHLLEATRGDRLTPAI